MEMLIFGPRNLSIEGKNFQICKPFTDSLKDGGNGNILLHIGSSVM